MEAKYGENKNSQLMPDGFDRRKREFYFSYSIQNDMLQADPAFANRYKFPLILKNAKETLNQHLKNFFTPEQNINLYQCLKQYISQNNQEDLQVVYNNEKYCLDLIFWKEEHNSIINALVHLDPRTQSQTESKKDHLDDLSGLVASSVARSVLTSTLRRSCDQIADFIYIDVDGMKKINDSLGHLKGDQLIREIGCRIRKWIGKNDIPCRMGGDEFAILRVGDKYSNRELNNLKQICQIEMEGIKSSASIGRSSGFNRSFLDLYQEADRRMYQSRKQRANKIQPTIAYPG